MATLGPKKKSFVQVTTPNPPPPPFFFSLKPWIVVGTDPKKKAPQNKMSTNCRVKSQESRPSYWCITNYTL
jgi:hypothetical protein